MDWFIYLTVAVFWLNACIAFVHHLRERYRRSRARAEAPLDDAEHAISVRDRYRAQSKAPTCDHAWCAHFRQAQEWGEYEDALRSDLREVKPIAAAVVDPDTREAFAQWFERNENSVLVCATMRLYHARKLDELARDGHRVLDEHEDTGADFEDSAPEGSR